MNTTQIEQCVYRTPVVKVVRIQLNSMIASSLLENPSDGGEWDWD